MIFIVKCALMNGSLKFNLNRKGDKKMKKKLVNIEKGEAFVHIDKKGIAAIYVTQGKDREDNIILRKLLFLDGSPFFGFCEFFKPDKRISVHVITNKDSL